MTDLEKIFTRIMATCICIVVLCATAMVVWAVLDVVTK